MGHALLGGVYSGTLIVVYLIIIRALGLTDTQPWPTLDILFLLGGIVFAVESFKRENDGRVGLFQAGSVGMVVTAVAGAISRTYYFVLLQFIDDSFLHEIIQEQKGPGLTQDQVILEMKAMALTPFTFAFGNLVLFVMVGFALSALVALLRKGSRKA